MRYFFSVFIVFFQLSFGQNISQKLDIATKKLLNAEASYSANLSFYVADEQGDFIFEYQGNKGLSTASTQKIFTAAAALETLGKDYRWTTSASYSGEILDEKLQGDLFIFSNGDPTLGSWRYDGFKPEDFKNQLIKSIKNKNIKNITGNLVIDDSYFDFQTIPGGWAWNDLGNYYGAGIWGVNWRENQFDIETKGNQIKKINVELPNVTWVNELKTAGNSDQSLIFTASHSNVAYINGSLPAKDMTVSGAMPNPPLTLGFEVKKWLSEA
ncbi:MAG: D-alanyl-D-alanine carboxypeptidase/D-alanyl-D-alanine-endopeptidase, partial [Cruoricaptor ignavus]|nr:D-alanyl-D-alanine carboxypeptidase/D-alanyl-D-alanine-endopeptidase [Cruoricaptor ignavus]